MRITKHIVFLSFLAIPVTIFSQNYEELVEQALLAAQHDSLLKSESLYKQALKINPNDYRNALAYHNLAHVQEMMYWQNVNDKKMLEEAVYNYSKAIEMQPESVPMRFSRGNLNLNMKNYDRAILDYTSIIEKDASNVTALNRRGYSYFQKRDYDKARQDYEQVLKINPNDYPSAMGVALVLQKTNKTREALTRMDFLIAAYPDKAELYVVRSSMYEDLNMRELALIDLNRAIELEPKNPQHYLQRAELYDKMKKRAQAKNDRRKAQKLIYITPVAPVNKS